MDSRELHQTNNITPRKHNKAQYTAMDWNVREQDMFTFCYISTTDFLYWGLFQPTIIGIRTASFGWAALWLHVGVLQPNGVFERSVTLSS